MMESFVSLKKNQVEFFDEERSLKVNKKSFRIIFKRTRVMIKVILSILWQKKLRSSQQL